MAEYNDAFYVRCVQAKTSNGIDQRVLRAFLVAYIGLTGIADAFMSAYWCENVLVLGLAYRHMTLGWPISVTLACSCNAQLQWKRIRNTEDTCIFFHSAKPMRLIVFAPSLLWAIASIFLLCTTT